MMKWIVLQCENLKNGKKIYKRKKEIFMFLFKSNLLANERIIRRISFIDSINMESRIMILVKVWYEWINLIKMFEWERVYIHIVNVKRNDVIYLSIQERLPGQHRNVEL